MKYFTADLLVRFGSEDDAVADAAQEEWEQTCERYNAYLTSLKDRMPPGPRQIEESYYLHDATIQGMGRRGQFFVLILQLDTPPQSLLTFTYDLVEAPLIVKDALPAELCGTGGVVEWQYNEIEMVGGDPPTWRESLLLSNGWELTLHFRDVQVEEVQAVLPAPRTGAVEGVCFVPQPAAQG